jgi:hypothetical protein
MQVCQDQGICDQTREEYLREIVEYSIDRGGRDKLRPYEQTGSHPQAR